MKRGQKIYFYDNTTDKIEEGVLISTEDQSNYDELPALLVKSQRKHTMRILRDWAFSTKSEAESYLVERLKRKSEKRLL